MRKRGKLQLARETYNRWKSRGTLDNTSYNKTDLINFIDEVYLNLETRKEKHATGFYIRLNKPLKEFTIQKAFDADKEFRQTKIADGTRNFISNLLNKEEHYQKRVKKAQKSRKEKCGSVKQSYIRGLINKGKRVAVKLNITDSLTNEEYLKLSGYQKQLNHSKLSLEEKEKYKLDYKITHLRNPKIRTYIEKHYDDFKKIDLTNISENEINFWYSTYMSVRSAETMNTKKSSRGITGFHYTLKNPNKVYYRSSYEKRFCELLDVDIDVVFYETEPYHIKYTNSQKQNKCYVPDFRVVYTDGSIRLFEIKPKWRVDEFIQEKLQFIDQKITILTEDELWKD